jgi:hypothetical protein
MRQPNIFRGSHAQPAASKDGPITATARPRQIYADSDSHPQPPFSNKMIHCLRKRWQIPTVKINGKMANPPRWPDGSYSVQGAAGAIGITPQVIFDWLQKGWVTGKQLGKGMPWQIALSHEQIVELRARVRRTTRSKREAS